MSRLGLGLVLAASLVGSDARAATAPVTLRWEPIPGAASYEVEIAPGVDFSSAVERQTTTATRLTWTPPDDRPYWWRVRAIDVDGLPGEFSLPGVTGAALPAPEPIAPPAGSRLPSRTPVLFRWRASGPAVRWKIEVSPDPAFGKIDVSEEVTSAEWKMKTPRAGKHHWRVIAFDVAGRASAPSAVRTFTVKKVRAVVAPAATPSPKETPPAWSLAAGARAGVFHNFGEVTAPVPAADVSLHRARMRATLQVGHYEARSSPSDDGVTVESSLSAVPLSLVAALERPLLAGTAYAGGGATVTWFEGRVDAPGQRALRSRALAPSAIGVVGWERAIARRAMISVEIAASIGSKTRGIVEASGTGVSTSVGVRVPFGRGPS